MARPQKPQPEALPVLEIVSCVPALEYDGKTYARLVSGKDIDGDSFTIRERTGIEVEQYVGKPLECVLEIMKATFYDPRDEETKVPDRAAYGDFIGIETGYKFFPELVEMVDGETGSAEDDDFNEDEYDILATKLFAEWGVCGFGLDVYRDKPMIRTEGGTFLLNEYIFEEWVDKWLESESPKKPVRFIAEEFLLHGIKPYDGKWERKVKVSRYGFVPEEGKMYGIIK